jgi:WD40 repeat protein
MELKTGKVVAELPDYIQKSFVQFTADSKLLLMGSPYSATIWDVSTWEQLDTHGGLTVGCGHYFTPKNKRLAVISNVGILFTYDEKIEKMCGTKPLNTIFAYYFYDPHRMLFILGDGNLWVWNFDAVKLNQMKSATTYPLSSEIFLAGDQASGWYAYKDIGQGKINIENISGGTGTTIDQQNDYQYRVALLPSKKLMALGSKYGSIHIWTMP